MKNKKYVLLVEDDPDIRDLISEVLRMESITVETANNGEDAIKKLQILNKPNLILLDLMMPKTDGIWFCLERKKYPQFLDIPIFILSADAKAAAKTMNMNVNGILKKPIKIDDLMHTVQPYFD